VEIEEFRPRCQTWRNPPYCRVDAPAFLRGYGFLISLFLKRGGENRKCRRGKITSWKNFCIRKRGHVGASRNPLRPNHHLVRNLVRLRFAGRIYPINPEGGEILGLKTFPDLKSVEGPVDLAVVAVPSISPFVFCKTVRTGILKG